LQEAKGGINNQFLITGFSIITRSQKYASGNIILCAFCQKNFFFAIKLHKKKIIVARELD
jgi:hypothetical protein